MSINLFRITGGHCAVVDFLRHDVCFSPARAECLQPALALPPCKLILILSFQIVFGYIFRMVGLFAAIFMMGLALGSIMQPRKIRSGITGTASLFTWPAMAFTIPGFIFLAQAITAWSHLLFVLFLLLTLAISIVTGITFSVLSGDRNRRAQVSAIFTGLTWREPPWVPWPLHFFLFRPLVSNMASCLAGLLNVMVIFNTLFRQKMFPQRSKSNIFG